MSTTIAAVSVTTDGVPVEDPELEVRGGPPWWLFLVTGMLWLLFSMIVFRMDLQSAAAVGYAIGALCCAAGINEFFALGVTRGGWKIVRGILGVLFITVGIFAFVYPTRTFIEVAAIFSFFLLFKGTFDIVMALVVRKVSDLWWIGLVVGLLELGLAFWCAGAFGKEAQLLLIWAAAGALARGITEIILAFRIKALT